MKRLAILFAAALLVVACGRTVDPATAVAEARALFADGKPGEARILLKNALAKSPSLSAARVVLAELALDEGNAKAAEDEMSAVDAATLAEPATVAVRVRIHLAMGRAEEAQELMLESGQGIPEPDRSMLQSKVLLANDSAAEALALLRTLQQSQPASQTLAIEVAGTLAAMGNLTPAIAELDRYLASGTAERADALRARGELHLRQGAPDKAVEDFTAARKAAPANWPRINRVSTELMMGDALLAAGDIAAAKAQIAQIEENWPGLLGTELLGAQLALLEGRPSEAAERMAPIASANPDNVRLQYLLIDALVQSGNMTRATELLERRVDEEPATSPARHLLATLYMQQGRPDRVIQLLGEEINEEVLESEEDGELLAAARLAKDQASAAISTLTAALEQNPDDQKTRAALATAQTANGDPSAALVTLGPMPLNNWVPESAAARMAALLAIGNEFDSNRLVDRLLDPATNSDVAVLLAAADVAYRARQNANVSRLLDRAAALDPQNTDVQLRRASLAFDERKYDEAGKMLQKLVDAGTADAYAKVALARVAEAQGEVDRARAILNDAISSDPAEAEPALMLASLELRANRPAAVTAVLDRLVEASAGGDAPNAAGLLLSDESHFEEARTRFRQAVDREPDNAQYWYNLGQAQLALSDRAAARESFARAASLQPDSLPASTAAVRLGLEEKNLPAARRAADAAAAALPGHPGAALLQGQVALAEGRGADAEAAYARSFSIRPSATASLGEFRARVQQRSPRADEPLVNWLAREPEDFAVRRVLSDFYLSSGIDESAREQLEIMIEQEPNDVVALNNLAWLLRSKDKVRAEKLAIQASAIAPDNPAVADTLGVILLANGKDAEALAVLKKAVEALPEDRSIQNHYAEALKRVEESR